jgi:hypothetical protein
VADRLSLLKHGSKQKGLAYRIPNCPSASSSLLDRRSPNTIFNSMVSLSLWFRPQSSINLVLGGIMLQHVTCGCTISHVISLYRLTPPHHAGDKFPNISCPLFHVCKHATRLVKELLRGAVEFALALSTTPDHGSTLERAAVKICCEPWGHNVGAIDFWSQNQQVWFVAGPYS